MHSKDPLIRPMKRIAFFDEFDKADRAVTEQLKQELNLQLMLQFDLGAKNLMEQDPKPDDFIGQMNLRKQIFSEIQEAIKKTNSLIDAYNTTSQLLGRKKILSDIQEQVNIIDNRYPASYFAANLSYRKAHEALFSAIKYQKTSMGVPSLVSKEEKHSPLSEIIANMAQNKADQLLGILINGNQQYINTAWNRLYQQNERSPDAIKFRTFLNKHQISFLGGHYSKNFLITNTENNSQQVLKVDFRLDLPRNIEVSLRSNLSEHFSPIYVDRQVTCTDNYTSNVITRSLQVTDYYPNGSLFEEGWRHLYYAPESIISSAANKLQQMACILLELQEKNFMHPDAKISNWLVDETGTLRIADTKSFVFIDKDSIYSNRLIGNEFTVLLRTEGYYPPDEVNNNAKAYHAYTFGINLYGYVSGQYALENFKALDYNLPVFAEKNGLLIKTIIEGLVEHDPTKRMSLEEASKKLTGIAVTIAIEKLEEQISGIDDKRIKDFIIKIKLQLAEVQDPKKQRKLLATLNTIMEEASKKLTGIAVTIAIEKLEEQRLGFKDKGINDFIRTTKLRFAQAHDPKEQRNVLADLNQTIKHLENDPLLSKLKTIIQNYRETASWKTIGMKAKADRIEKALAQVPIHERLNLLKLPQSTEVKALMKELALHRYPIKGYVFLNEGGGVDENRAATKYKEFKSSIEELRKKSVIEAPSSEEVLNSPSPKKP